MNTEKNGHPPDERRILVVSDTHGSLPDRICDIAADTVLHAGDIGDDRVLAALHCFDTVHAVRGNTDTALPELPDTVRADIAGVRFFLVHNLTAPHRLLPENRREIAGSRPRLVVFGHTHQPLLREEEGILYLNPGSLGRPGVDGTPTYAVVTVAGGAVRKVEICDAATNLPVFSWP
ncbi:MAG TPA: metallophosphoesterase family protein [bacterium]|nr:metallophosphoesterase family protein [bacterium]